MAFISRYMHPILLAIGAFLSQIDPPSQFSKNEKPASRVKVCTIPQCDVLRFVTRHNKQYSKTKLPLISFVFFFYIIYIWFTEYICCVHVWRWKCELARATVNNIVSIQAVWGRKKYNSPFLHRSLCISLSLSIAHFVFTLSMYACKLTMELFYSWI